MLGMPVPSGAVGGTVARRSPCPACSSRSACGSVGVAAVDRGGAGDLGCGVRAERRDGERRDRLGLRDGADGERRTRRAEGREGDHGQCTERPPGTAMHHPGGPSATHKVSIPVAGRDRRPQSVCAPTPQWRGWRRVGLDGAVFGPCLRSVTGPRRPSPTNAPRRPPGSTGSPAPRRSNPTRGCPTPPVRTVWLKREDLQVGRSYKLRGAYNLIAQLGAGGAGGRRGVRQRRQPRAGRRLRLPTCWGSAGACTCRAPRRGRSATGSSRWAATTSS